MVHRRAKLTPSGRLELVMRVVRDVLATATPSPQRLAADIHQLSAAFARLGTATRPGHPHLVGLALIRTRARNIR